MSKLIYIEYGWVTSLAMRCHVADVPCIALIHDWWGLTSW